MNGRAIWLCLLIAALTTGGPAHTSEPALATATPVVFEGNERFSRRQLLAALRRYHVSLNEDFARTDADDAAFFLSEFYFSEGFAETSVEYNFTQPPSSVVFLINEGGQQLIRKVEFAGNRIFTPERLRMIFDTSIRQANLHPFGRLRYVTTAVDFAMSEIQRALRQKGFLDASATFAETAGDDTEVDLKIFVNEGIQYHIEAIQLFDTTDDTSELEAALAENLGKPYEDTLQAMLRTRVQDWYRNRGHLNPQVRIDAARDAIEGNVSLTLTAVPGPRFRLGQIRIEGLQSTLASAIRKQINIRPGAWYDTSKIDAGVRRLWFTGAFSEVSVTPESIDDDTADAVLKIEEGRAKQVRFKIGYNEWERAFGEVQYVDRNFLGTLNRFSIDTFASQRGYGVSSTLADPWFLGTEAIGSVGAYYSRRELPAYETTEFGGTISYERRFNLPNETGYRFVYTWKRATDSEIFGDNVDTGAIDYTLGGIGFSQTWDTRNSVLSPMKGAFATHEVEVVSPLLLGDLSFFRFEAQFTYYHPLQEITTERPFVPFLVFNQLAGMLLPYGDTEFVPVQERFFLGGPTTMRSYQLYGFGPKDSEGYPTGGLAMLLGTAELQWPVWNNIYTVFFTDVGNLASEAQDFTWNQTQVAIGSGLRVYTPIGAIRIDYGYNVNRNPGDPIGNWQIGFGLTF